MSNLTNKVAIVTGASRGIGRAVAERLAADGATVVVNYVQSAEKAQEIVNAIESKGGKAIAIQADAGIVSDIRRLFQETIDKLGRLDILVNNAGSATFSAITDVTEEDYDALFALNTKGVFFALQEAAKSMADGGRIINISSGITILGSGGGALYAGTKGAVEQFTMAVAKELGRRGITVNTVSPGKTKTELLDAVVPLEIQNAAETNSVFGRLGEPGDIADVISLLVSEEARWITAQNIRATGGEA